MTIYSDDPKLSCQRCGDERSVLWVTTIGALCRQCHEWKRKRDDYRLATWEGLRDALGQAPFPASSGEAFALLGEPTEWMDAYIRWWRGVRESAEIAAEEEVE
jgi:hypothetical protein